jgi:hypothetical protein
MTKQGVHLKDKTTTQHQPPSAVQLDSRICGYCANSLRDVHNLCSAEAVYRHFAPELMGRWEDLPDPVAFSEILTLPAHAVRALFYRDIWYLVHKIRAMDGYFD